MKIERKYYILSEDELINLIARDLELTALENYGVDNWIGYGGEAFRETIEDFCEEQGFVYQEDMDFEDCAQLFIKDKLTPTKIEGENECTDI